MEYVRLLSRYKYAELRIEREEEASVKITNEEIKQSSGTSCGFSVRILENGSWGFASANGEVDRTSIERLLWDAQRLARLTKGKIKLARVKETTANIKAKTKDPIDLENILDSLKSAVKIMDERRGKKRGGGGGKANGKIISKIVSCTDNRITREFYNSEGSEIAQETAHTYLSCTCIARSGENIQRGSERLASLRGFGSIDTGIAYKAKEKALRLLGAEISPKGRFSAVLDPEMTGVFSHEALGHACEADAIIDKESILRGKLGKRIGNELVSIADDPTAEGYGGFRYDEEGVEAERVALVEKGILRGYMNSRETSESLNAGHKTRDSKHRTQDPKPNGHARAQSYDSVPVVRMSNTHFARGKDSHADVFDVKVGIYLKGMRGGSVDTFSGGFMFKAEEAYEIKNGELGKLLRDVTMTGNVLGTMLNVEAVGKDFGTSPGYCGKNGQLVPVSDGGPHIRVKNVTIG